MQHQTPKHHAQATGAAKSCSKHSIMIQKSPSEATVGCYWEASQYHNYSLEIAAPATAINKYNPKESHEISPRISTYTQDWINRTMLLGLFHHPQPVLGLFVLFHSLL